MDQLVLPQMPANVHAGEPRNFSKPAGVVKQEPSLPMAEAQEILTAVLLLDLGPGVGRMRALPTGFYQLCAQNPKLDSAFRRTYMSYEAADALHRDLLTLLLPLLEN